MTDRISVTVNGCIVEVYAGMEVQHALTAYDVQAYAACRRGEMVVVDEHGFRVGLTGTLHDGARLFVQAA